MTDESAEVSQSSLQQLRMAVEEAYASLLQLYINDVPARLDAMRVAAEQGDMQQLALQAHTLKGSSSNIGALRLAKVCHELVVQIRDAEFPLSCPDVMDKVDAAIASFAKVRTILEQEIATGR